MGRSIAISKFKAECLGLLTEVAETGEELTITRRGKPIARVLPAEQPRTLRGSVTFLVPDDELVGPVEVRWDAETS